MGNEADTARTETAPETAANAPAPARAFPIRLRNETAYRVIIRARTGGALALHIPSWGERIVTVEEADALDLDPWISRSILRKETIHETPDLISLALSGAASGAAVPVFTILFYAALIWAVWELFGSPSANYWPWLLWTFLPAVGLVGVLIGSGYKVYSAGNVRLLLQRALGRLSAMSASICFAGNLAIAFGLPALVLTASWLLSTELPSVTAGVWLNHLLGAAPAGRILQWLFIGTLSVLPAMLYFVFDRRKLSGLREHFFRAVVQLDPGLRTLEDARSVYGGRADETLGPESGLGWPRTPFSRELIILVTTIVVTLGWLIAIDPLAGPASGADADTLFRFLEPQSSPFVFAFLGGYVFSIGMLFRRYVRSDLKPEAFAHILVRIATAVLITWAVSQAPFMTAAGPALAEQESAGEPSGEEDAVGEVGEAGEIAEAGDVERVPTGVLLAAAFMIGWFPEIGVMALREQALKILRIELPRADEQLPLERLDGINVYHRARLMDEGVDNIENLAHADVIDLMLGTRIPIETLLDWIDQAILLLHTAPEQARLLREHGIRTATDLERALQQSVTRSKAEEFIGILGREENGPARLQVITDAVGDDPWMPQLRFSRRKSDNNFIAPELLADWDQGETALLQRLEAMQASRRVRTQGA